MKFKDTKYGDLTNEIYDGFIVLIKKKLTSLEGSPKIVEKNYYCDSNKLTSLVYSPKIVKGDFDCSNNKLISLEYSPKVVKKDFNCSNNKLKNLLNSPQVVNNFICNNNDLISLEGCTKQIKGVLQCINNKKLKNVKNQIIKYQIKAIKYLTDEGDFYFEEIKEEFIKYKNNNKTKLENIKNIDYGLSI